MALEPGPVPEVPDDPDRVIAIVPTGGTTGLSKAAVWTHRTWDAVTAALWTSCPARGAPVHLVAAPMTHGAGAVAMRTPVRPDAIGTTPVRLFDTSSGAELLARATLTPFYGIDPASWVRNTARAA